MTTRVVVSSCHQKGEWAKKKRPLTFLSHQKPSFSYLSASANVCLVSLFLFFAKSVTCFAPPSSSTSTSTPSRSKRKEMRLFYSPIRPFTLLDYKRQMWSRGAQIKSKRSFKSLLEKRGKGREHMQYECSVHSIYCKPSQKEGAPTIVYSTVTVLLGIHRIDSVDFECLGGFGKKNANARKRSKKIWALYAPSSKKKKKHNLFILW